MATKPALDNIADPVHISWQQNSVLLDSMGFINSNLADSAITLYQVLEEQPDSACTVYEVLKNDYFICYYAFFIGTNSNVFVNLTSTPATYEVNYRRLKMLLRGISVN